MAPNNINDLVADLWDNLEIVDEVAEEEKRLLEELAAAEALEREVLEQQEKEAEEKLEEARQLALNVKLEQASRDSGMRKTITSNQKTDIQAAIELIASMRGPNRKNNP